jgi:hypothetical protein
VDKEVMILVQVIERLAMTPMRKEWKNYINEASARLVGRSEAPLRVQRALTPYTSTARGGDEARGRGGRHVWERKRQNVWQKKHCAKLGQGAWQRAKRSAKKT